MRVRQAAWRADSLVEGVGLQQEREQLLRTAVQYQTPADTAVIHICCCCFCSTGVQQWQLQVAAIRAVHTAIALRTLLLRRAGHQPMPALPSGRLQQPGNACTGLLAPATLRQQQTGHCCRLPWCLLDAAVKNSFARHLGSCVLPGTICAASLPLPAASALLWCSTAGQPGR